MSGRPSSASHWSPVGAARVLLTVILSFTMAGCSDASHHAAPSPLFGTLDTQIGTVRTEKSAGISVAMFELDWKAFEPSKGVFSASYLASTLPFLRAFRAAGMRVTLGLGLE